MYFCCMSIHLPANIILGPSVKSWDGMLLCCCCFNKGCCRGFGMQVSFQCYLGMWNQKAEERQWKKCIYPGIGTGGVTWRSSSTLCTSWLPLWKTQTQKLNHCWWDATCFFAHLGWLHAPQSQRNPSIVWELAFLNWKTKVIYIFFICMSFSFLLLALHALQTELEKNAVGAQ